MQNNLEESWGRSNVKNCHIPMTTATVIFGWTHKRQRPVAAELRQDWILSTSLVNRIYEMGAAGLPRRRASVLKRQVDADILMLMISYIGIHLATSVCPSRNENNRVQIGGQGQVKQPRKVRYLPRRGHAHPGKQVHVSRNGIHERQGTGVGWGSEMSEITRYQIQPGEVLRVVASERR